MWPRVRLGHPQVGQEEGHRLGDHRTATIRVQGQLVGLDPLLGTRFADQVFGQSSRLALSDQPADHVAAKDVQNGVEIVVGPLDRTTELGDIPTLQLIGAGGQQLGLGIGGVSKLVASLTHQLMFL